MANANQIQARGTVVEDLKRGAYRVELANGHRCIARAPKELASFSAGDEVALEFHLYDLSRGRIIPPA
jgi:translation initiation factor IF-1